MKHARGIALISCGIVACGLAYVASKARAGGPPLVTPLTYSGLVTDAKGAAQPLKPLAISLWDAVTNGVKQCGPVNGKTDELGRFAIALDDACAAAVKAHADLWLLVNVDGVDLPRSKLGAAPYALEAARAVAAKNDTLYSGNGIYCGTTAAQFTGNLGGFAGAKTTCETKCSSPSAHMCTADEIVRSMAMSVPISGSPWYATFTKQYFNGNSYVGDCASFKSSDMFWVGHYIESGQPNADFCNASHPVACCD